MPAQPKYVDFSDWSGGKNTRSPQHALPVNQVADTMNLIHEQIGGSRAPGFRGISAVALFPDAAILGEFQYITSDGTEHLIVVSNAKVYSVNLTAGTKTELGAMTGADQAYAVNAAGKLWIVNGTSFVKVESDLSVYPVQLVTPVGTSAVKKAGGTLPDGVYGCYASYARKDASGRYLYSLPYSMGDVTLGGGDNTITFTVPAPTDDQITHIVAWMTDAGGAVPYYYGEADEDAAAFDVASAGDRLASVRMDVNAASNQALPITPAGIFWYGGAIMVWDTDTVYWSLRTDINPFDLERYLAQNFRTFPVTISSMFAVDLGDRTDLFINSVKIGVHRLPFGDMTEELKKINQAFWFKECMTAEGKSWVAAYNNLVFGYTNDGIRFFNGQAFSDDLSFDIKPDMDRVNLGVSSSYRPAMCVFRRSGKRTELRFSYRDLSVSSTINNRQLVYNLDYYFDPVAQRRTWETWEVGFNYYTVIDGAMVMAQNKSAVGVVAEEFGVADELVYDSKGTFLANRTPKKVYLLSGSRLARLDQQTVWGALYALAIASGEVKGNYVLFDEGNTRIPFTLKTQASNLAILPAAGAGGLVMPVVLQAQTPQHTVEPMPYNAKSSAIAIEIEQTADDNDFRIYNLQVPRAVEITDNMT